MLKFENVKVLGIQETIEAMIAAGHNLPGDSYGTIVCNEGGFSYTIGDGDLGAILGDEEIFNIFSSGVIVYANAVADDEKRVFIASYSDIYILANAVEGGVRREWYDDFLEFITELPYMKTIMDYFAFCEACENAEHCVDEASEDWTFNEGVDPQ